MLKHFTWPQFFIAVVILTLIWYAGVILLFYRRQITDLLKGKRKPSISPEPMQHHWEEDEEYETIAGEEDNLVGKPALPEGMSELSMAQFGFAPKIAAPAMDDEDKDTQLGLIPDVIEELKSIFHILETEGGGKTDFISLFGLVSTKYPKIRNTPNQQALNDYIRENLPFGISNEELNNLWI
ncbi:hypothetical protein [Mucilaginibacter sp.]